MWSVKNSEELLVLIMLCEALGEGAALGVNVVTMAMSVSVCLPVCLNTQYMQNITIFPFVTC